MLREKNRKIVFITAGSLLVVVALALVIIKMIPSGGDEPLPSVEDAQNGAFSFTENNDIDGGLKYYDEQIEARENTDEKKALLLHKSSFAQSAGRFDEALKAAQQAGAIAPNAGTAEAIARAYEAQGDKEQALIYYKKLLELSPKDGLGSRYIPVWEEKIRELEE